MVNTSYIGIPKDKVADLKKHKYLKQQILTENYQIHNLRELKEDISPS